MASPSDYSPCECGCGELSRGKFKRTHRPTKTYKQLNGKRIHVLKAEAALGKPLPEHAQVHHVDLTKSTESVLVICENDAYHKLLHVRTRIVKAGGNPNTDSWCSSCKTAKNKDQFYARQTTSGHKRAGTLTTFCKECSKRSTKNWKRAKAFSKMALPDVRPLGERAHQQQMCEV